MLVSSHLMGELQDMADQVVVVGRGQGARRCHRRGAGGRVGGRSGPAAHPRAGRGGRRAASMPGLRSRSPIAARSTVSGSLRSVSSRCCAKPGVAFSEVTAQRASLEDVYLQLTGGETEYRAGTARERCSDERYQHPAPPDRDARSSPERGGFGPCCGPSG